MPINEIATVAQRMNNAGPSKGTGITKSSIKQNLFNKSNQQGQARSQQKANPIPYRVPGQPAQSSASLLPEAESRLAYGPGGGKVDITKGMPPLAPVGGSGKKDSAGKIYLTDDDAWVPDEFRQRVAEMPANGWRVKRPGDVGYDPKAMQIALGETRPGEQRVTDYGSGATFNGKYIANPNYKPPAPKPKQSSKMVNYAAVNR